LASTDILHLPKAHEAAVHREKLRVELSQSRQEQNDYLRQVELKRVLDKRSAKKRKREEETGQPQSVPGAEATEAEPYSSREGQTVARRKRGRTRAADDTAPTDSAHQAVQLDSVLHAVF
jgi:ESF2/ABP1 family protein